MIEALINKITKYIPSYPPLQSFNASNPLIGLHELPFDEAIASVAKYAPISGTLALHKYHAFWQSGKININDLSFAIKDFLVQQNIQTITEDAILELLLDKSLQSKFADIDSKVRRNFSAQISGWYVQSNQRVFSFVARFFDIGQAKWQMPVKSNQLYLAWLEYAKVNYSRYAIMHQMTDDVYTSIRNMLNLADIHEDNIEDYLLKVLFQIIGWASFVHWLELVEINPYVDKRGKVADIIAIWLAETSILHGKLMEFPDSVFTNVDSEFEEVLREYFKKYNADEECLVKLNRHNWNLIWQLALEHNYRDNLVRQIKLNKHRTIAKPTAQLLFCVDVRSEGLRRYLESYNNYQTFGTAGFFGVGFDFHHQHNVTRQSPDWSTSHHYLHVPTKRLTPLHNVFKNLVNGLLRTKKSFLAPLVLFDVVGLWFSLRIMANTLMPWKKKLIGKHHQLEYNSFDIFQDSNYSIQELSQQIAKLLRSIGLCNNFSELIVVCGHLSESVNNPFISSLHCGACGGNSGAPNAIAFCQAINDPRVRSHLSHHENIHIPVYVQFVAATHNTTTDQVDYYYNQHILSIDNIERLDRLKSDLELAGRDLCNERQLHMDAEQNVDVRKGDWAELQPELGQVNNAALVIGPRGITRNINLQRSVFLQSYDSKLDLDGSILNDIFNSTVKVVNMINSQYYFSTTDQNLFGSGNKVLHNIVSQLGVMEGNSSDLKIGFSQQSLFYKGESLHLPLRLCIIVCAPESLVTETLAKNKLLTKLIEGKWLNFYQIDRQ